jgi:hypothetical protein
MVNTDLVNGTIRSALCITGGTCVGQGTEDQRMTAGIRIAVCPKTILRRSGEQRQHDGLGMIGYMGYTESD